MEKSFDRGSHINWLMDEINQIIEYNGKEGTFFDPSSYLNSEPADLKLVEGKTPDLPFNCVKATRHLIEGETDKWTPPIVTFHDNISGFDIQVSSNIGKGDCVVIRVDDIRDRRMAELGLAYNRLKPHLDWQDKLTGEVMARIKIEQHGISAQFSYLLEKAKKALNNNE